MTRLTRTYSWLWITLSIGCAIPLYPQVPSRCLRTLWSADYESYPFLGASFFPVGDLNNDGWIDFGTIGQSCVGIYFGGPRLLLPDRGQFPDVLLPGGGSGIVADFDGDGRNDLVTGENSRLYMYRGTGGNSFLLDTIPEQALGKIPTDADLRSMAAGDLNGDGYADLVIANYGAKDSSGQLCDGAFVFMGGKNFELRPNCVPYQRITGTTWPAYAPETRISTVRIAEVNGDSLRDLIIGLPNQLRIFYGMKPWRFDINAPDDFIDASDIQVDHAEDIDFRWASILDLNNDGINDILASQNISRGTPAHSSRILIFHGRRGPIPRTPNRILSIPDPSFMWISSFVSEVGDLNNDGYQDFMMKMYRYQYCKEGKFLFYPGTHDGISSVPFAACTFYTTTHYFGSCSFAGTTVSLGDINGDGTAEFVTGGVIDGLGQPHVGTMLMSGDASLVVSTKQPISVPESFSILAPYPNPFSKSTTIGTDLRTPAHVIIVVRDPFGRTIVPLMEGQCDAGPHNFSWDGRTRNGSDVPSGVYFITMQNASGVSCSPVLLLR